MQFQLEDMEVNVITPVFLVIFNSEFKQHEEEVYDIDLKDSTLEIMQNCLNVYITKTIEL
jgi:hypothetical protein